MNEATTRRASQAIVVTGKASLYLQQLCKHFGHKLDVEYDDRSGSVRFSIGDCRLLVEEGLLRIALDAPDEESMLELQNVVDRHLRRFAFREDLSIAWQTARS